MKLQAMKDALKARAVEIKTLRAELKKLQRAGDIKASTHQYTLDYKLSPIYRHMHIAYCELRGTPYERIEPKVREGNEPSRRLIDQYKEQYAEELVNV
jgi:hypothetical protein